MYSVWNANKLGETQLFYWLLTAWGCPELSIGELGNDPDSGKVTSQLCSSAVCEHVSAIGFQFLKLRDGECGADSTWKRWGRASAYGQGVGKTAGGLGF